MCVQHKRAPDVISLCFFAKLQLLNLNNWYNSTQLMYFIVKSLVARAMNKVD